MKSLSVFLLFILSFSCDSAPILNERTFRLVENVCMQGCNGAMKLLMVAGFFKGSFYKEMRKCVEICPMELVSRNTENIEIPTIEPILEGNNENDPSTTERNDPSPDEQDTSTTERNDFGNEYNDDQDHFLDEQDPNNEQDDPSFKEYDPFGIDDSKLHDHPLNEHVPKLNKEDHIDNERDPSHNKHDSSELILVGLMSLF